jgi:hypothetical protein
MGWDVMFPVSQTQSIRSRQKCANLQYSGSGESRRLVMTDGFLQMYDGGRGEYDDCTVQFTVFGSVCVCVETRLPMLQVGR